MLRSLQNIETAFSHVRLFLALLLVSNILVVSCAFAFALRFKHRQEEKVYALQGEESVMCALNQNISENRPVEAKATIELFHQFFLVYIQVKRRFNIKWRRRCRWRIIQLMKCMKT